MHTDDHILETFLASNKPLAAIASDLSITLIALVRWMDSNVDLLAAAKRAMETRITFLALHAEAVALTDLTTVSQSSTNEERKRKSASQLLRHTAKRLLSAVGGTTNPAHEPKAPRVPKSRLASSPPNAESRMPNAASSPNALPSTNPGREPGAPCASKSQLDASMPPASLPSSSSHSLPSTNPGREPGAPCVPASRLASSPNASSSPNALPSTNPGREPGAPCASKPQLDASMPPALMPSSSSHSTRPGPAPSTSSTPPSPNAESRMPNAASSPNALPSTNPGREPGAPCVPASRHASSPTPAPLLNFSDHEIDVLMVTLAHHFNLDLASVLADPADDNAEHQQTVPDTAAGH